VLRQMLVCYESILAGESSAFFPNLFARGVLTGLRKKCLPRRSLALAARGCNEKSQGSIAEVKTPTAALTRRYPGYASLNSHLLQGAPGSRPFFGR